MLPTITTLFSVGVLTTQVFGHGQMVTPYNREGTGGRRTNSQKNYPYSLGEKFRTNPGWKAYNDPTGMRCNGYKTPTPENQRATLKAGETFELKLDFTAYHAGDCFLYMSDKNQDQNNPKNWYKIWERPGCTADNGPYPGDYSKFFYSSFDIRVPDDIPACEHCVLR
eukprot:Pgem_evm1s9312